MLASFRSLKMTAFGLLTLAVVMGAELSQAVAEGFLTAEEDRMVALVNEHRAAHGFPQLQMNEPLRMVARRHAQQMAMNGYIYHNPNLRADANEAIPGWRLVGENVGVGPSTEAVQEAFLNSHKHHDNIDTSSYNVIGLGAIAGQDGMLFFTQNFAQWTPRAAAPPQPRPAQPAPRPVAPRPAAPRPAAPRPAPAQPAAPVPTIAPPPITVGVAQTTFEPVSVPEPAAVLGDESANEKRNVGLAQGLVAMLARFFSKLAFWR